MATKVHMEALSPTMEEGQLVKWLKDEGDEIASGDVLAEIETDKATMELVARGEGVLRKRFLAEGATAPVGAVIGVIATADEDISAIEGEAGGGGGAAEPAGEDEDAEESEEGAEEPGEDAEEPEEGAEETDEGGDEAETPAAGEAPARAGSAARKTGATPKKTQAPPPATREGAPAGDGGRLKASPLARRLAEEQGIELSGVQGSGPGGRIVKRDIEAAAEEGAARPAGAPAAAGWVAGPSEMPEVEEVPVSQMRKAIAKRLVTSIGPVPTFYLTTEVDMRRMVDLRARINKALEESGEKVSLNDLLIKAVAGALRRHPEVNASWQGDVIERYGRVHIGVAVAIDDGLITPIVRDADRKGVAQVAREVKELAGRAREKRLQPDEYTGATFSISNLGMFGIDEFTAIINPPEAAILAVGRMEEKAVVEDGEVVVRPRMRMTMSCDHRVVDGAMGARFLQTLSSFIEEPGLIGM